MSLMV